MDSSWELMLLFAIVVKLLVPLLFVIGAIALVVKLAKAHVRSPATGVWPFPWVRGPSDFQQSLALLQRLIEQAQQAQRGGVASSSDPVLPPGVQAQWQSSLLKLQSQMRDMNALSRARHDTFVSGMLGQASSAGLDVSSWHLG